MTWPRWAWTSPTSLRCPPLAATSVPDQGRPLDADDVDRWRALGLAIGCADLVGVMRGALALATEYARDRRQYGAAIGSFQAIQHQLADALVLTEGSAQRRAARRLGGRRPPRG